MQHQLREHREHIQEQHMQLTMAQQQMRENIQGKTDYEQHMHHEMQTVTGKYELMGQRAEIQAADHQEHRQYLSTVAETQRQ